MAIKKVAWFGNGRLGLPLLTALSTSEFDITVLLRRPRSAYSFLPSSVRTASVDFTQHSTLVDTLSGQDAVVVVTQFVPGSDLDRLQLALIDAAIEAGVKLFIPSEWAPDTVGGNGASGELIGAMTLPPTPVIAMKRVVHNYLMARASEGKIAFATIHPGVILERWIGSIALDFISRAAELPDGGYHPFSMTSLQTVCRALAGVLSNYPQTRNRFHYIADGVATLDQFVTILEHKDPSGKTQPWIRKSIDIVATNAVAIERMKEQPMGVQEFLAGLRVPFFGGLTVWKRLDNRDLGIKDEDRVDVREEMERIAVEAWKRAN
ncbi:NAD(P)-binding protein [Glonium stellatum]|uniref:NAD(P)-binding protein n=1 Tax=Glonium stellatum TaxID=574774 RepID=A0A8E2ETK8_9PEZI|nr:NAD(P)-binding protein [Glonium stellatum]